MKLIPAFAAVALLAGSVFSQTTKTAFPEPVAGYTITNSLVCDDFDGDGVSDLLVIDYNNSPVNFAYYGWSIFSIKKGTYLYISPSYQNSNIDLGEFKFANGFITFRDSYYTWGTGPSGVSSNP